jgi:hypothetical protein
MISNNWELVIHIIILLSIIALIFVIVHQKYFGKCDMCACRSCNMCPCQCSRRRAYKGWNMDIDMGAETFVENFTTTTAAQTTAAHTIPSLEDKLYENTSRKINEIYSSNYNNIKQFLGNQIDIDSMIERVTKINNKLETNLNKKTVIATNGELKFY